MNSKQTKLKKAKRSSLLKDSKKENNNAREKTQEEIWEDKQMDRLSATAKYALTHPYNEADLS